MSKDGNKSAKAMGTVRELTPADLDRVVEIDRAVAGQSRRGFFDKRIAARARNPRGFISLGYVEHGELAGFALGHLLDGEFGGVHPVAVLDAIGIAGDARGHGGGHAMLAELENIARQRGARELRTQSNWSDQEPTHFFASNGMELAHRVILVRPCSRLAGEASPGEIVQDDALDYSRDRIPVRSLKIADLSAITLLDRAVTGRDRSAYYKSKIEEAVHNSGVRLSMLATIDDTPAGFVMARVDYGEFGRTEPASKSVPR
jgi:GNAT superfamily N-acetyltransferase